LDTLSDNRLMLKVKDGDFNKMGLLYERYSRQLFGFVYHMTMQKELSEDLVQNVFFRMLKYRKTFTGKGEFKTWIYHVARNVLNDHYRKAKRTPYHSNLHDCEKEIEEDQLVDKQMEKKQEMKILELALGNLSKESRELLILFRFQGLKHFEIARILNISEGYVRVRIHRALIQLKNEYVKIETQKNLYGMRIL
jgi:RNA polymerase sigma factor (sigma-70 family)